MVRRARPAAFIKTISDILCFPFRPLFPPAVLAWCPMVRGGEPSVLHPHPHPAMPRGASGRTAESRKVGSSGQMSFGLLFALKCALRLKMQEVGVGACTKGEGFGCFQLCFRDHRSLAGVGGKGCSFYLNLSHTCPGFMLFRV